MGRAKSEALSASVKIGCRDPATWLRKQALICRIYSTTIASRERYRIQQVYALYRLELAELSHAEELSRRFGHGFGFVLELSDASRYGPKGSLGTACLPANSFFSSPAVRAIIDSRTEN